MSDKPTLLFSVLDASAVMRSASAMCEVAKIAKPTGSKLVNCQAESGEICSVEVEEK
jgi:hypothetical protein